MRSSKTVFINFLVIFLLGFCVFVYLVISVRFGNFSQKTCENGPGNGKTDELMLNGVKLSDLQNLPFLPILPLQDPPDDRKTLQIPMFTFAQERGLGQMLFELAALFGISDTLDRIPIINRSKDQKIINRMNDKIRGEFPIFAEKFLEKDVQPSATFSVNLNIRHCCIFEDPKILSALVQQHVLLNGFSFQSFKYFEALKTEIRQLLSPKPMNSIRAEAIIPDEFRRDFLICVHTKQPEVRDAGISSPSEPFFTRAATDFLVDKYKKLEKSVTVAVFGNDPIWAHDLFFDKIGNSRIPSSTNNSKIENSPNYTAILTPGLSEFDDFAFSRNFCDVVFLSAPTSAFGWWMGYLAKETAHVYYRDPQEVRDQIVAEMKPADYFPPEWLKLTSREVQPKK